MLVYWLFVGLWIVANVFFWVWWLRPEQVSSGWFYTLMTLAFAYDATILPTMYLFYVGRMREPMASPPPEGLRVAVISLCVPSSESLNVIERQLRAMAAIDYPHDSWVLDEGNDPEVRAAAERLGVRHFSRRGVARYNQPRPPFQGKTKAGNVNAWLEAYGKEYDFFVQLDIDHVPRPDYLHRVLGHFRDQDVAWVQGPSLYGNLDNWVARGSAEQELVLQGPLQQGFYGASETPFIIGSHCTYRTSAVLEIGGFQPTRAEDHLDTVLLASRGYRGAFVPSVLALGNGPDTFETYLRQQFAWAYSMMQVLFKFTPRLVWKYRPVQAVQFLFAQTWYTCWSTSMLVLFSVPMIALLTGERPSTADLPSFALRTLPLTVVGYAIWRWTRRWQLPRGVGLTWRGVVLHVARWPIVFWALVNVLLNVKHPYMITPKREEVGLPQFALLSQSIYLGMAWIGAIVIWIYTLFGPAHEEVQGFVLFALWGLLFMLAVVAANVVTDLLSLLRRGLRVREIMHLRSAPLSVVLATTLVLALTTAVNHPRMVEAATWVGHVAGQESALDGAHSRALLMAAAKEGPPERDTTFLTSAPPAVAAPGVMNVGRGSSFPDMVPDRLLEGWVSVQPLPLRSRRVLVGAYDPWERYSGARRDFEHWYVRQDEPTMLRGALSRSAPLGAVLVTVEPWPSRSQGSDVLGAIVSGQKDQEIRRLAQAAKGAGPSKIYLRWAHEMELIGLYPWSVADPSLYQQAYRRFVSIFRAERVENVYWVWSPAGNEHAWRYYPGDDVVDYIGMTILGHEEWDKQAGLAPQSFRELMLQKYPRFDTFGKPMMIAELGVSGSLARQERWLSDALKQMDAFPKVELVAYFNARNAPYNGLPTQPDWRLDPELFDRLAGELALLKSWEPANPRLPR